MRVRNIATASLLVTLIGVTILDRVPAGETEAAPQKDYVVGIEDQLRLVVWGEPDLTLTVTVRPDGKITVPLIQDVHVAGHTPEEIRREIQQKLAEGHIVRDPSVTIIVEQINSYRVYFLGEIGKQGVVSFYRPTRLLQAIAAAGGLTEFSKKRITLLREQNGVEKRLEIDYKQLISGSQDQENLYLLPGDTLLVN